MQRYISLPRGTGLALILSCALIACGKLKQSDPNEESRLRAEAKRHQSACGSSAAFEPLKDLLFDKAIQQRSGDRAALDTLADYSFVRMEDVVVTGWDASLEITRCHGRLILEVPAGARAAFSGQQHMRADIDYTAQAAADRNGFVYKLTEVVPFVAQLATFNLSGRAYRPPAAFDEQSNASNTAPIAIAKADAAAAPANSAPSSPPLAVPGPVPVPTRPQHTAPTPTIAERTSVRKPRPSEPSSGNAAETVVRTFYAALGRGDGELASAQIIPEKQGSRAYSPAAISRFYGRMRQPLQLTSVTPLAGDSYSVSYRYSTGRARCDGKAIVKVTSRNGRQYIRSIQAPNGC